MAGGLGPGWRELERLILDHKLRHGGHPILRWMAANVATVSDGNGNIKPHKNLERLIEALNLNKDYDRRWITVGKTHLQEGLMALTRAVARPETF